MGAEEQAPVGRLDGVNRKVYNMRCQMRLRAFNSDPSRYSAAYATGRERIVR